MSSRVAIEESARSAPVGVGWATIISADPATQVGLIAGVLTCIYMLGLDGPRIEDEKLAMIKRENLANKRDPESSGPGGEL